MEGITVFPITSVLSVASVRARLKTNDATGFKETSEVEINKITTIHGTRLNKNTGEASYKNLIRSIMYHMSS